MKIAKVAVTNVFMWIAIWTPYAGIRNLYQFFSVGLVFILLLSPKELSCWLCLETETRSPR